MSASSAAVALDPRALSDMRILRYAVGTTIAVLIAQVIAWDLSYLMPMLALGMLASPAPRPTVRGGLSFVAIVAVACFVGVWLGLLLLPYPAAFLLVIGLLLLRLFYAKAGGAPPLLITVLVIASLLIPALMMQSYWLAIKVAGGLVVSAIATVLVVWLVYGLFPDPPGVTGPPATSSTPPPVTSRERFGSALLTTTVVFPVVVWFFLFQRLDAALIIIFVAMLSMQPGFAKDFKAGFALILGNTIGGLCAILMYQLLTMVPSLMFFLILILLAGLLFGRHVFSAKKTGALYGMAFSTVLLIIGSVTGSTSDASDKVYSRIVAIMIAVIYVVVAFGFLERWLNVRRASRA
jgi:hypothetical protein